jgi:predicted PurR-regulated permease PerM
LTVILQTLSFLFIPLCFAILACYAMGIPMEQMKRFKLPKSIRIIIIIAVVNYNNHRCCHGPYLHAWQAGYC